MEKRDQIYDKRDELYDNRDRRLLIKKLTNSFFSLNALYLAKITCFSCFEIFRLF